MVRHASPTVMVLDGDNDNTLQVARELSADLDATVVGVGTSPWSRLLRSRYCDVAVTTVPASDPRYPRQLLDAVGSHDPGLLLPVGYHSVAAVDVVRDQVPDDVACWLPPTDSLSVAVDKAATTDLAADVDVDTPADYTDRVAALDARGRPGAIAELPFPVFVKARHECGETVTARVDRPAAFWDAYDDLREEAGGGVIVQEFVPGERTYGCGLLYEDGSPRLLFAHEEVRSVPRRGGSGTRVRVYRDPALETAAIRLLDALEWHGPALVEFKRRADGTYVLMEINPKLWASYALASQSGYRFVSAMAARALDLPDPTADVDPERDAEMCFPLRELYYAAREDDESLLRSAASMCRPSASFDVNLADIGAWLTPPAAVVDSVGGARGPPPVRRVEGPVPGGVRTDGSGSVVDREESDRVT